MPDEVTLDVTTIEENVTVETTAGDVVEIQVLAPSGAAATITVGTTTTLAPGSSATVANAGTSSAAVFNFGIPTGATGATGAAGANGGSSTAWRYRAKTNATSGYPTNGHLLWNNAMQVNATEILVSHLDDEGSDIELFLSFFAEGQKLFIQNRDDSSQNQIWEITGTPTVTNPNTSTAYYTFPVTLVSSQGAEFTNNHSILFGTITEVTNSVTSATTSDGTANLSVLTLGVVPSGSITLASTNSGGFVQLNGQAATDARSIAFPNASGTLALTSQLPTLGTNVATFLATPTSANLASALTDENGTGGGFVRAEGATLTSPALVGPINLTSQDASTADRVMTRNLSDTRYGQKVYSTVTTTSSTVLASYDTLFTKVLPVGYYRFEYRVWIKNNEASASISPRINFAASSGTISVDGTRENRYNQGSYLNGSFRNASSASHDGGSLSVGSPNFTEGGMAFFGFINVTAEATMLFRFSHNTSAPTNPTTVEGHLVLEYLTA